MLLKVLWPSDPPPDPKAPASAARPGGKKTRKQRREALYKTALTDHLTEKAA